MCLGLRLANGVPSVTRMKRVWCPEIFCPPNPSSYVRPFLHLPYTILSLAASMFIPPLKSNDFANRVRLHRVDFFAFGGLVRRKVDTR
ncbi:hypothetical protein K443DRAFT_680654 [Laccaria amethystina LaAM-08-1]|uniref:Uncharacterized protein n=1 Tax=Laccaria amethystina LaAM-08-1 TaxID=1095629 RepID=A0A0C9X0G8_9AGAR|nr:hypothetical protein K443DRAFT_680654 [Laccaria amethystina LaAM-08-1]